MLPTRDPLQTQGHVQTESEGMEKDIPCKWKPKESIVAIVISAKIDFNSKTVTRGKEGYQIIIKGSIHQEDIHVNMYAYNFRGPTYIKQILAEPKGEIDNNTIIVRDFNISLPTMNRSTRQKINEENFGLELPFRSNRPKRYIKNFSSNSHRIYILLKLTWNIQQDRPHSGS